MGSCGICLVIEDDPDIGGLLETILTGMGFDVQVEATGTAGLVFASGVELALITLDVGLPDMDGRDLARRLRDHSDAPILMITAFAQREDELDGMAAGADAYLIKPFRTAQLRASVLALCPRAGAAAPYEPAIPERSRSDQS